MTGPLPNRELLRVSTVAQYLDVSEKTVYLWCDIGKLRKVQLSEKCIRVERESVVELMKKGQEA